MLSSGMITPLFFIFPGNFTHSAEGGQHIYRGILLRPQSGKFCSFHNFLTQRASTGYCVLSSRGSSFIYAAYCRVLLSRGAYPFILPAKKLAFAGYYINVCFTVQGHTRL
jgi:hypothetical protein